MVMVYSHWCGGRGSPGLLLYLVGLVVLLVFIGT